MNEIIQPFISMPSNDTLMFVIGVAEFMLCFGFAFLIAYVIGNYDRQRKLVRRALIIHVIAWCLLILVGFFFIPHERQGSYLDVYANLAIANMGFMMVMAIVCGVIAVSNFKTGLIFALFFGGVFGAIGGKGIGDFISPQPMHAQIDWLSFDETDKNLTSLRVGLKNTDYQQSASIKLAEHLQRQELLTQVDFSDGDEIKPPIQMDLVQAPYSAYLYLPEEYDFTPYGKKVFFGLLVIWLNIFLTALVLILLCNKPNAKANNQEYSVS